MNRAAAVFFHEVFGHRAEGHRLKDEDEGHTFKKKLGEKVVPEFISVVDDPTRRKYGDSVLNGWYRFDDEGVLERWTALLAKAANVEALTLTGTAAINGTGNALNNTVTGNSAANVLDADGGDDTLNGGAGADTLIGGTGNDTLVGGLGDDTYVVDGLADVVTELAGQGTDEIRSSVTFSLLTVANVENLTLTGSGTKTAFGAIAVAATARPVPGRYSR